jgi:CheY-like chemotaxis protein
MMPDSPSDAPAPPPAATTRIRVLVVEDEPPVVRLVEVLLTAAGYAVDVANTGQEAILMTHNHVPAVVVMDVMTPELDGLEATRYLKARYGAAVQVLVLTALDGPDAVRRAEAAGAEYFATKPLNGRALVTVVGRLAALSQAISDADAPAELTARVELARMLIEAGHLGLARSHLEAARSLDPDAPEVRGLAARFVE